MSRCLLERRSTAKSITGLILLIDRHMHQLLTSVPHTSSFLIVPHETAFSDLTRPRFPGPSSDRVTGNSLIESKPPPSANWRGKSRGWS